MKDFFTDLLKEVVKNAATNFEAVVSKEAAKHLMESYLKEVKEQSEDSEKEENSDE